MLPANATPAIQSATYGIQQNLQVLDRAAGEIANPASQADVARSIINLKVAQQAVAVNAEVLRTADEALGTLIDILA